MAWRYKTQPHGLFINDNQSNIGNNYPAWQTETYKYNQPHDNEKWITLSLYTIYNSTGYEFDYVVTETDNFYHFNDFKNLLKSAQFIPREPQKTPSFLAQNGPNSSSSSIDAIDMLPQDMTVRISSSNDFVDTVGEVKNDSPSLTSFVKVIGTFYDSSDKVVGTGFTYTQPSDIPIGQTAPFELILLSASIPIPQIHHYKLKVKYQ